MLSCVGSNPPYVIADEEEAALYYNHPELLYFFLLSINAKGAGITLTVYIPFMQKCCVFFPVSVIRKYLLSPQWPSWKGSALTAVLMTLQTYSISKQRLLQTHIIHKFVIHWNVSSCSLPCFLSTDHTTCGIALTSVHPWGHCSSNTNWRMTPSESLPVPFDITDKQNMRNSLYSNSPGSTRCLPSRLWLPLAVPPCSFVNAHRNVLTLPSLSPCPLATAH